jgi:hypothetical protein
VTTLPTSVQTGHLFAFPGAIARMCLVIACVRRSSDAANLSPLARASRFHHSNTVRNFFARHSCVALSGRVTHGNVARAEQVNERSGSPRVVVTHLCRL